MRINDVDLLKVGDLLLELNSNSMLLVLEKTALYYDVSFKLYYLVLPKYVNNNYRLIHTVSKKKHEHFFNSVSKLT